MVIVRFLGYSSVETYLPAKLGSDDGLVAGRVGKWNIARDGESSRDRVKTG
jgi:hypothetical protein